MPDSHRTITVVPRENRTSAGCPNQLALRYWRYHKMVGSVINKFSLTSLKNTRYLFRWFACSVFHAENGQSAGQFHRFSRTQESAVSYKKYTNVLFHLFFTLHSMNWYTWCDTISQNKINMRLSYFNLSYCIVYTSSDGIRSRHVD